MPDGSLDMRKWRIGQNTVTEIEEERSTRKRSQDAPHAAIERAAPRAQDRRIEIALHWPL